MKNLSTLSALVEHSHYLVPQCANIISGSVVTRIKWGPNCPEKDVWKKWFLRLCKWFCCVGVPKAAQVVRGAGTCCKGRVVTEITGWGGNDGWKKNHCGHFGHGAERCWSTWGAAGCAVKMEWGFVHVCTCLALTPCCNFPRASSAAGDAAAFGPWRGLWDFKYRTPKTLTAG